MPFIGDIAGVSSRAAGNSACSRVMSPFGTKRTWWSRSSMSAFRG